jgi:hypothetical protein
MWDGAGGQEEFANCENLCCGSVATLEGKKLADPLTPKASHCSPASASFTNKAIDWRTFSECLPIPGFRFAFAQRWEPVMSPHEIAHQIQALATAEHVDEQSAALVEERTSAGAGLEVVEPILRFMEAHGDLDYGPPGALVHFVERFYRQGYEGLLLAVLQVIEKMAFRLADYAALLQETVDRRRRIAEILNRKYRPSTAMIVACTGASGSPPMCSPSRKRAA